MARSRKLPACRAWGLGRPFPTFNVRFFSLFGMTLAIRPPAYFPSLHDTALLAHVDHFILADTFRFRHESFHNRSKLRNAPGTHAITIPLFGHAEGAPLHTIEIETKGRWQEKHWRSFLYDYRSTMYFDYYKASLRSFYEQTWTLLADCTCRSIELQAELFGLQTSLTRASTMAGRPDALQAIVEAVGPDALVVPETASLPSNLEVEVHRFAFDHPTYHQNFEGFEPYVTALDLLFNYGPEARRPLMDALTLDREESP